MLMSVAFSAGLADLPEKRREAEKETRRAEIGEYQYPTLGITLMRLDFTLCSQPPKKRSWC